ncbi:MAG: preprotein translocase subunit YajC [Planctomycetota bacterium]
MTLASPLLLLAEAPAPATNPGMGSLLASPLVPILLVMVFFMYMSWSSQRKQKKAREAMLAALKKGDGVTLNGGEIGKIVDLDDKTVLVKVDETNNTKIRYRRDAVLTLNGDPKADKADKAEKTDKTEKAEEKVAAAK